MFLVFNYRKSIFDVLVEDTRSTFHIMSHECKIMHIIRIELLSPINTIDHFQGVRLLIWACQKCGIELFRLSFGLNYKLLGFDELLFIDLKVNFVSIDCLIAI